MDKATFIDTNQLPRTRQSGAGEFVEIMNNALCGAKNGVAALHWLAKGDHLDVKCDAKTHQLVYLMEGEGTITLNAKDHKVAKGAGIYLGPSESARISHAGSGALKLFHITVALPKN
jgi:glyoxylate utilization-related uncharacterized protein